MLVCNNRQDFMLKLQQQLTSDCLKNMYFHAAKPCGIDLKQIKPMKYAMNIVDTVENTEDGLIYGWSVIF